MSPEPHSDSSAPLVSAGFGREFRLLNPEQFTRVFKNAERTADRYWTLLFVPNQSTHPRLGMAVAKKKIRNAVDRNRVKRIVRESFRTQQTLPAVDIVVLPSARCKQASSAEIRASLNKHWDRITIKCGAR